MQLVKVSILLLKYRSKVIVRKNARFYYFSNSVDTLVYGICQSMQTKRDIGRSKEVSFYKYPSKYQLLKVAKLEVSMPGVASKRDIKDVLIR